MDALMSFTKEMEKIVDMNDPEGLGAILNMRQGTMDRIDSLNKEISRILSGMEPEEKNKVKRLLESKGEPVELDGELESEIFNTNRTTLALLAKIVELDNAINKKVKP